MHYTVVIYNLHTITAGMLAICLALGLHMILCGQNLGLCFVGIGVNLLMIVVARPGHPLTQSLALTAVVISTGTVALWFLNANSGNHFP